MQRNVKSLIGFSIGATDGEIGKVDEFYFDDETWTIRYLVVKTGSWLLERKVLISPAALNVPDWGNQSFPVNLTKEQVKHSPDIDTEIPVSRQQELELYSHYGWPFGSPIGVGFYGIGMMGMVDSRIPFEESIAAQYQEKKPHDPHLRGTHEIKGYGIYAVDGAVGTLSDLIIDEHWKILFLVADTGKEGPGTEVLIPSESIKEISWVNSSIGISIGLEELKDSPF